MVGLGIVTQTIIVPAITTAISTTIGAGAAAVVGAVLGNVGGLIICIAVVYVSAKIRENNNCNHENTLVSRLNRLIDIALSKRPSLKKFINKINENTNCVRSQSFWTRIRKRWFSRYDINRINDVENLTDEQLYKIYKQLACIFHPDKPTGDKELFQELKDVIDELREVRYSLNRSSNSSDYFKAFFNDFQKNLDTLFGNEEKKKENLALGTSVSIQGVSLQNTHNAKFMDL